MKNSNMPAGATRKIMPLQDSKKSGPESLSSSLKPKRIFCELDADTFALVNWVRMKHHPADMDSWLRATLTAAALDQAKAQIAGGRELPQGMAELITRVRGKR